MRRSRSVSTLAALGTALALAVAAPPAAPAAPAPAAPTAGAPALAAAPALTASTVVSGLSFPWDLTWVGDLLLFDTRGGQVWSKNGPAAAQRVTMTGLPSIFVASEGGLLGIVAEPEAATTKRFYTCQAVRASNGTALDVRVLRWRMTSDTAAVSDGSPVVTGIPLTSGRHTGCRLRFGTDGMLYVGTGDAATGTNPQNLQSLGGKVLRVQRNGVIPRDNPFYARGGNARYVWNYGHRNVQGLALRAGTTQLWSAEHGTDRDDEVNALSRGANFGWDPIPGYNEARPMTDLAKFPSAKVAMWSSGNPTIATSGATFLTDPRWGAYRGMLAVGLLKGQGVLLMRMNPTPGVSPVVSTTRLPQGEGLGRVRTAQEGPDGALWLTTSNGTDDKIVRVAPTDTVPAKTAGQLVSDTGVALVRTGTEVSAFIRTTGDAVVLRRSTDDGATFADWSPAGVTSTNAPSAASSARGRYDLVTRSASGGVVQTYFRGATRLGSTDLGGTVVAQHAVSLGDGTLDVFAVAPNGVAYRQHWDRTRWSGWRSVGGEFTSGLSASADPSTGLVVVSGRGTNGATYERTFSRTAATTSWQRRADGLSQWSDRAVADTWPGYSRLSVGTGPDGAAVVGRGSLTIAVPATWTSAGDIVSRADGSFLMAARSTDGALWLTDGGPRSFRNRSLGGVVR